MIAALWLVAAVAGWVLLLVLLFLGLRTPPERSSGWPAVALGLAAIALGVAVTYAPSAPAPSPPPVVEPVVEPAPAPWPPTALQAALHRPAQEPPFRDPVYKYRFARLLVFDDGVVLAMSNHPPAPTAPCALDDGRERTLFLPEGDVAQPGELQGGGTFAGLGGSDPYTATGEVRLDRVEGERRAGVVDLTLVGDGQDGTLTGTFDATVTHCPATSTRLPGQGGSDVAYAFALDGHEVTGTLTWSRLLRGLYGNDQLVFQLTPSPDCSPRAPVLAPLSGIWFTSELPEGTGPHRLTPGVMPGQDAVKTWTWFPPRSASHNLGVGGVLQVDTVDEEHVDGTIDVEATVPYGPEAGQKVGTIRGRFDAEIVDCSAWKEGLPM
jgi:hypothetical protein